MECHGMGEFRLGPTEAHGGIEFVLKKIPPPFFFRERIMKKECLLLERSNRAVVFVHLV